MSEKTETNGIKNIISISNIKKSKAIKKYFTSNSCIFKEKGWKPHSYGEFFSIFEYSKINILLKNKIKKDKIKEKKKKKKILKYSTTIFFFF